MPAVGEPSVFRDMNEGAPGGERPPDGCLQSERRLLWALLFPRAPSAIDYIVDAVDATDRQDPHDGGAYSLIANRPRSHPRPATISLFGNFLYMITEREPDPSPLGCFDRRLILHSEHKPQPPHLQRRVTASTLNRTPTAWWPRQWEPWLAPCMAAPIEDVLAMSSSQHRHGTTSGALWIGPIAEKQKIMGFGHRE